MNALRRCLVFFFAFGSTAALRAAPPAMIEVQLPKETLQGKVLAHSEQWFVLVGQDGRLRTLPTGNVKKFRQVASQFSGWPGNILRDQLRHEFGKSFDVSGTRHYAVCATDDRKARAYSELFEDLFRNFQMYFSVRGFKMNEPEFPLVAVVFPDYASFARYATSENVAVSRGLKGYYSSTTNRIVLYEDASSISVRQPSPAWPGGLPRRSFAEREFSAAFADQRDFLANTTAWGTIEGTLKDTMIHEATHQAAFNTGLHSRIGETPKWVVEGLATVFEAPGICHGGAAAGLKTRINRERFLWFGDFSKSRRKARSLESFLGGDELFQSDVFDAYSQAWAFSFFLIETRPRAYAEYLRTIAARDPLHAYPPEARVADFKQAVSKELPLLEAEFLRFVAGIK